MTRIYAGFNIADSMFAGNCVISRQELSEDQFKAIIRRKDVVSVFNRSHEATINAIQKRFAIRLPLPEVPPRVVLEKDDYMITVSLRGLPRHTNSYQYSDEEVQIATFVFAAYRVIK